MSLDFQFCLLNSGVPSVCLGPLLGTSARNASHVENCNNGRISIVGLYSPKVPSQHGLKPSLKTTVLLLALVFHDLREQGKLPLTLILTGASRS